MTPEEFVKIQDNGFIAGDYTPAELYLFMKDYAIVKMIEENKSILAMAELHMDTRAVLVIKQRIFELEKQLPSES
jgi:hypothetical protein